MTPADSVKPFATDGSTSYYVAINVNGRENIGQYFYDFRSAERYAEQTRLRDAKHLKSYRVEVVENFCDRSRFAIYDKSWEE